MIAKCPCVYRYMLYAVFESSSNASAFINVESISLYSFSLSFHVFFSQPGLLCLDPFLDPSNAHFP